MSHVEKRGDGGGGKGVRKLDSLSGAHKHKHLSLADAHCQPRRVAHNAEHKWAISPKKNSSPMRVREVGFGQRMRER